MAPVRRSGFFSFENADVIKVHSQRVNGPMCAPDMKKDKFNLISKHADQEGMVNVWIIHAKKDDVRKMVCQRCRYFYMKDKKQFPFKCVAALEYNVETNEVNCDPSEVIHFKECCPEELSKVRGTSLRREVQNSVQYVGVKTVSTALCQMDRQITLRYAGLGSGLLLHFKSLFIYYKYTFRKTSRYPSSCNGKYESNTKRNIICETTTFSKNYLNLKTEFASFYTIYTNNVY